MQHVSCKCLFYFVSRFVFHVCVIVFYCHILSKKDEPKGLESVVCLATVDNIRKIHQGQPNVAVVWQRKTGVYITKNGHENNIYLSKIINNNKIKGYFINNSDM